ncbi:MAG: septal ring lytic transglycosylase RlpA family protein [Pseudomonadota bacterium]
MTPFYEMRATFWLILLAVGLALSACSGKSTRVADSGPDRDIDVSEIPNAVPREEPPSRYGNPKTYSVFGKKYRTLASGENYLERGMASWYGTKFHGRRTSSGETYDMYAMTAAHRSLPLPTYVEVTNLDNGKKVVVKVNDRGPFHSKRIIDLSYVAAKKLGFTKQGTSHVEVRTIGPNRNQETGKAPAVKILDDSHFVQVGAFSNRENAQQMQSTVQQLQEFEVTVQGGESDGLYRVVIGPVGSLVQAGTLADHLRDRGMGGAHPVIR